MLPAEVKVFHPTFWGGELYLDKQRLMYKELGNGKERRSGWFWLLFTSFISLPRRSRAMKYLGPDASESYEVGLAAAPHLACLLLKCTAAAALPAK